MIFQALSIVYPAATKIATGLKAIEIRSWKPSVLPLRNLLIVENRRRLDCDGDSDPDGWAVALVDIEVVREWTETDAVKDGHRFVPGYYAWEISHVRPLNPPLRAPAERLIYEVSLPDEIMKAHLKILNQAGD